MSEFGSRTVTAMRRLTPGGGGLRAKSVLRATLNPLSAFRGLFGGGIKRHRVTYLDPDTFTPKTIRVRGNPAKQRPIPGYNRLSPRGNLPRASNPYRKI